MINWIKDIVAAASLLVVAYGVLMAGSVIEQMVN